MKGWREVLEEASVAIHHPNGILAMAPVEKSYYINGSLEGTEEKTLACALACCTIHRTETFSVDWLAILDTARELLRRRKKEDQPLIDISTILQLVGDMVEITKHSRLHSGDEVMDYIKDLDQGEGLLLFSYPSCWAVFRTPSSKQLWLFDPSPLEGEKCLKGCSRLTKLDNPSSHTLFLPSFPVHITYLGEVERIKD